MSLILTYQQTYYRDHREHYLELSKRYMALRTLRKQIFDTMNNRIYCRSCRKVIWIRNRKGGKGNVRKPFIKHWQEYHSY